ncbi:hypothetical protein L6164_007798 [Bauhinia variegata]|uniref:Uncharacterized protein n=1 Tax=Bauhinia variegata TaxID=167791 RepID=A0ACB9PEG6_BAUVA|nr:hypothetical protein L6164_007798 [Bauhinia variegata]
MEETLLPRKCSEYNGLVSENGAFLEQLKQVSFMAAPMVAVTLAQFLLQFVSLMMAGHLGGALSLSGVALGTSFANVTGFSVILGISGALETLCGQTFGAEQFHKFGNYAFSAIICLTLVCVPISILYVFMDQILVLFGQDPAISLVAGKYCTWLIFALFGNAVLEALLCYFQTQSLIFPMVLSSTIALVLHIPICWALVFKSRLEENGAALAIGISSWLNVILLVIYMKYSPSCEKTAIVFSMDALLHIKEFFWLAIPSALMVCLEWWSFELLVLLSGLLPNPALETSVLAICLNVVELHYNIPYGIGAAASTRVSNELGAGRPQVARVAVRVVIVIAMIEAIVFCSAIFCCRHVLGYAFSKDKEVVDYVADITPLLCLFVVVDCVVAILSGIARGSGWQKIGAFINLGAYNGVGIPVSVLLAFVFHLRGKGLWIGILTGATIQTIVLGFITALTNWEKQAYLARERIFEGAFQDHNRLV